jgi:nucleolar protein 14
MTKRKNRSKRSLGSLPKGLPVRGGKEARNPFESAGRHAKRPKHEVVNRRTGNAKVVAQSALARAVAARKDQLKSQLQAARKSNSFVDKRIGEYDTSMTAEEQNLARIVKERARRSKRRSKFALDDQEDEEGDAVLTHRGKAIDSLTARDHVMLSDDEQDDNGQLDALDTLQHFGGGSNSAAPLNPYGPAGGNSGDLSSTYATRKLELDDLILRRKILKVERMKSKEAQVDTFEKMDDSFADLAKLLSFRDKEKEIKDYHSAKREGRLSGADQEMAEWDKEMKNYQFAERKVKALDRTKTPEEIAKNEAERLHELETRRMARMNGDFSKDDFSDIDEAELQGRGGSHPNPDELDDDSESDDNDDQLKTRFTADGLVKVDKDGNIVERVGQKEQKVASHTVLAVGTRVSASYHAKEQLGGEETWFDAVVAAVNRAKDGSVTYNVDYADGDFEDKVEPHHIKAIGKTEEELQQEEEKTATDVLESRKRLKAKEKAR